jgi:hypothetical protein
VELRLENFSQSFDLSPNVLVPLTGSAAHAASI